MGPWRWPTRPPLRVWTWAAATLALVVVAALLWRGSDAAATSRSTAAPAAGPSGSPAGELTAAWSAPAELLPDRVVEGGRVLVGAAHGITALDPLTGDEVWHYTRGNAQLCGATATDGVVVAVFRTADRCDEALALHADTGVYAWTRNVNFSRDVSLTSTAHVVLAVSPGGLVTIDPTGDNIRWRYAPEGCRILGARAGSTGVAVLQQCRDGEALQVRLLDGYQGDARWTRDVPVPAGTAVALAGADQGVSLLVGDQVQLLSRDDGAVVTTVPLPAGATGDEPATSTAAGPVVLVWARGTLLAVDADGGTLRWQRPALGPPTIRPGLKTGPSGAGQLLVPEQGGFVTRDPTTGEELGRSAVAGLQSGGVGTVVGPVVVYRLPDQLIGYR